MNPTTVRTISYIVVAIAAVVALGYFTFAQQGSFVPEQPVFHESATSTETSPRPGTGVTQKPAPPQASKPTPTPTPSPSPKPNPTVATGTGTLSGSVSFKYNDACDQAGMPCDPLVTFGVYSTDDGRLITTTHNWQNGTYSVELPAGTYTLYSQTSPDKSSLKSLQVTVTAGKTTILNLVDPVIKPHPL